MQISDLTVEVRDVNLQRIGQILPADLVGFTAILRYNNVGSWTIKLPNGHPMGDLLRQSGYGLLVTSPIGVLISGATTTSKLEQTVDDSVGTWTIEGNDDSRILIERLAYPTPSSDSMAAQIDKQDIRTGVAEKVIKEYVDANLVTGPASRKVANLNIENNLGRGSAVVGTARFETLQELLYPLAATGGIGYQIVQVDDTLEFQVYVPLDRSATIRMDLDNGKITRAEYAITAPKTTRVIVAGTGEGENRVLYEATTAESLVSESEWGRRIESFQDSRGSGDITELQQTGQEVLVENGKTITNTSVTPSDDQNMRFGIDWGLGDKVTVVIGNGQATAVVTEVGISVAEDGVRIGATVGTPTALDFETKLISNQQNQETRISNLERNSGVGYPLTYQPVWGGTGLTYSGTPATGTFIRIGDLVHFRIYVDCSTVTAFGTGQYTLTLPVLPVEDYAFRDGGLHAAGTHYPLMGDADNTSLTMTLWAAGASAADQAMTSAHPKALATTDYFYLSGTYQAKP